MRCAPCSVTLTTVTSAEPKLPTIDSTSHHRSVERRFFTSFFSMDRTGTYFSTLSMSVQSTSGNDCTTCGGIGKCRAPEADGYVVRKVFPPVDFLPRRFDVREKGETDNAIHVHAQSNAGHGGWRAAQRDARRRHRPASGRDDAGRHLRARRRTVTELAWGAAHIFRRHADRHPRSTPRVERIDRPLPHRTRPVDRRNDPFGDAIRRRLERSPGRCSP